MSAVRVNKHGAVYFDGAIIGWISWAPHGRCENPACIDACKAGHHWHAIPRGFAVTLPTYHYPSRRAAIEALAEVKGWK